jgi:hypothetical protein
MPSLEFFIVATTVAVDQRSNRVTIIEVIEELEPVRFPAFMPRVAALTIWNLSEDDKDQDFQAVLRVTVPGLETVGEFRQNFTAEGPTHRMLFQLQSVPVLMDGTILFEISLNGERKASHQIRIVAADATATDDGFLIYPADEQPRTQTQNDET